MSEKMWSDMNVGEKTIEWLYTTQLRVDKAWSIRTTNGFKWWADRNAQTVEIIGEELGPEGDTGYLISVRTEFLRNLELSDRALAGVNALFISNETMTGPVYDAAARTLSLCSLVRMHEGISEWMRPLISVAAVLQITEARTLGPEVARELHAQEALSGHPEHGMRPNPDELAKIDELLFLPEGQKPCKWPQGEFQDVVDEYLQQPPSLGGSAGGLGFTVEFPYGDQSSLCRVMGDQPHPLYHNGLAQVQSFPVHAHSEAEGVALAFELNATELTIKPSGYGLGCYTYRAGMIHFTSFIPNAAYRPGLLPNFYFACAERARQMSVRLMNRDWDEAAFSLRQSAVGRVMDRQLDK